MIVLAFDLGERRTGVALYRSEVGFVIPLDTITHQSLMEQIELLDRVAKERAASSIVLGLPLLPSGAEGRQASFVRTVAAQLVQRGYSLHFCDERFTTPRLTSKNPDAQAASAILQTFLSQQGIDI